MLPFPKKGLTTPGDRLVRRAEEKIKVRRDAHIGPKPAQATPQRFTEEVIGASHAKAVARHKLHLARERVEDEERLCAVANGSVCAA